MKTLEVIVKKRNELKSILEDFESKKLDLMNGKKWYELIGDERYEYSYIMQTIAKLNVQIDTLTYVINYDSEMEDVKVKPRMMYTERKETNADTPKIHKSSVFKSYDIFPSDWSKCLSKAQEQGYRYIDFNGMVFHTIPQSPERKNAICMREDLID